jgi:hypothetical protein
MRAETDTAGFRGPANRLNPISLFVHQNGLAPALLINQWILVRVLERLHLDIDA